MTLKFRRNYHIILLLVSVIVFFGIGLGSQRVIAYTTRPVAANTQPLANGGDITNPVALFDEGLVHSIQIQMAEEDYQKMLTTYQQIGVKDYFQADVVIDGVRVDEVGVRLKGHASLMTQVCRVRPGARQPEQPQPGEQAGLPPEAPEGRQPPPPQGNIPAGCKMPGAANNALSPDEISHLPLLIQFDRFVAGQTYQGYTAIAIRTGGTTSDPAMLQEPVTNAAYRLTDLPAPLTVYTGLQINAGEETLHVISEVIDEAYLARNFPDSSGVLYKALLGADVLTYKGADPSQYATSFSQKTRLGDADMAALIEFIRFINTTDDAEFARELPRYLDVDSFAAYLAINSLLVNMDSLVAGNGNNFYLYYNEADERMTLLFWDGNESLGAFSPERAVSLNPFYEQQGSYTPRNQSILITRFMAEPSFRVLYEDKLRLVYERIFSNGKMIAQAEQYIALVRAANAGSRLVALDDYNQAAENVLSFIRRRTEYLNTTELSSGQ
jgi:spore coat protein CotH